jgi:hypothetical protein
MSAGWKRQCHHSTLCSVIPSEVEEPGVSAASISRFLDSAGIVRADIRAALENDRTYFLGADGEWSGFSITATAPLKPTAGLNGQPRRKLRIAGTLRSAIA